MKMTAILIRTDQAVRWERIEFEAPTVAQGLAFGMLLADQRRRPGGEVWKLGAIEAEGVRHNPPANDHGPMDAVRPLVLSANHWEALLHLAQAGIDSTPTPDTCAIGAHRALRAHVAMMRNDEAALAQGRPAIL